MRYVVASYSSEVLHIETTPHLTECGRRNLLPSRAYPTTGYYRECVKCSQALSRKEEEPPTGCPAPFDHSRDGHYCNAIGDMS